MTLFQLARAFSQQSADKYTRTSVEICACVAEFAVKLGDGRSRCMETYFASDELRLQRNLDPLREQ